MIHEPAVPSPQSEPSPIVILVVDDEIYNRLTLEAILSTAGHHVLMAENGQEAVDIFEREPVDLVIMDIIMPVMDGYDAARKIKQLAGEDYVPMVFMTASTDENDLARCVAAGGDDFLTKPYSQVVLNAKIQAWLRVSDLYHTIKQQKDTLRAHQDQEARDQEIANSIFRRVVNLGCLDALLLPYHSSPMALFNGDLLLAAETPSGNIRIMLGDFTGHGLPAAVGAIPTAQVFYRMTGKGYHATEVIQEINDTLHTILPTGIFCAAGVVEVNIQEHTLQVWLGGLPDIFLYGGSPRQVKRTLTSKNIALGILPSSKFRVEVETIAVEPDDQLLLHTDGITETTNAEGEDYGLDRLKKLIESSDEDEWVMPKLMKDISAFRSGEQADDTSLIEIPCDPHRGQEHITVGLADSVSKPSTRWQTRLHLDASALHNADPIPMLLQMVDDIQGLAPYRADLFAILSELYNNALEHGLLGLDSAMKASPEGFLKYYEEHANRLAALDTGYIDFELSHQPGAETGGKLTIQVTDSGAGFDFSAPQKDMASNTGHSGRGIALITSLCESLEYQGAGNIVQAVYRWQ